MKINIVLMKISLRKTCFPYMDIQDLLVYKVKRPICIILNKYFLKCMECPFWGGSRGCRRKGTWAGG